MVFVLLMVVLIIKMVLPNVVGNFDDFVIMRVD